MHNVEGRDHALRDITMRERPFGLLMHAKGMSNECANT